MARGMKDSGIDWLEVIPADWKVKPLKILFSFGKGLNITKADLVDEGCPVISYGQIHSKKNTGTKVSGDLIRFIPPSIAFAQSLVKHGNFIFADTSEDLDGCGNCVYMDINTPLFAGYHTIVLRQRGNNDDNRYLAYLFKTACWRKQIRTNVNGVKLFSVSQNILKRTNVIFPPLPEQQAIADFLDAKCAEIDGLLADLEAEVKTLAEYKKSIIAETVTHGLNPNATLVPTNLGWIDKIPEHWGLEKAKYAFELRRTKGNIKNLELLSPTQKYGVIPQSQLEGVVLVNEKTNLETFRTIHAGDFCISLRSFQGGFEYSTYEGVVSPAYQVFYPTIDVCDGYYKYMFKSDGFISKINTFSMSLRDGKNIAFSDFGNMYIPIPPIEEQVAIAVYLDEKCAEIEQSIVDRQTQIETLKVYKASLIYEYVTGKKQVI